MGGFFLLSDVTMDIFVVNSSRASPVTCTMPISHRERVIYSTVKVSSVTAPNVAG